MNEAEWQEYRNSTYESMIAIETTFNPTLEITEDIANTTLEDLIKQNKGKYSKEELLQKEQNIKRIMKEEGVSREFAEFIMSHRPQIKSPTDISLGAEVNLKFVPSTSALAKVYYLEDMEGFIRNNQEFYNNTINEINEEKQNKIEEEAQRNWNKYL